MATAQALNCGYVHTDTEFGNQTVILNTTSSTAAKEVTMLSGSTWNVEGSYP